MEAQRRVQKVAVYELDMARMRWEEVNNIGAYSLFVDCAGKSTAACVDVGSCGVKENRVYVAAPGCRTWKAFPPGWEDLPSALAVDCLPKGQWSARCGRRRYGFIQSSYFDYIWRE